MRQHLEELLVRIRALQEEVEEAYRQAREELDRQRQDLAGEFLRRQQAYKQGLLRYLAGARLRVVLTAPLIYAGWIPFLLLDLFVTVYQAICFRAYGIPRVRRGDYLVFDRERLPYLNLIERFNCFYCTYGNGVVAYAREVAGRTEQYWCPIKHARRLRGAHDYYPKFLDHGDAEAYRRELARLRRDYEQVCSLLDKQ
ncbi:MAG: hypothetical protein AB1899_11750 [Pseudomonadota bacterium]